MAQLVGFALPKRRRFFGKLAGLWIIALPGRDRRHQAKLGVAAVGRIWGHRTLQTLLCVAFKGLGLLGPVKPRQAIAQNRLREPLCGRLQALGGRLIVVPPAVFALRQHESKAHPAHRIVGMRTDFGARNPSDHRAQPFEIDA